MPTIIETQEAFRAELTKRRLSDNTVNAYDAGLKNFILALRDADIDPAHLDVSDITKEHVVIFMDSLRFQNRLTSGSIHHYAGGFLAWLEYLNQEGLALLNFPILKDVVKNKLPKKVHVHPDFDEDLLKQLVGKAMTELHSHVEMIRAENPEFLTQDRRREVMRCLRDIAIIKTLADTGLRNSELRSLVRRQIDWDRRKLKDVELKGGRKEPVFITQDALDAIKEYHAECKQFYGTFGKQAGTLPVFCRHDRGAGHKILPITPMTVRRAVKGRGLEFLGEEAESIHPHQLRHKFATDIFRETRSLEITRRMVRHKDPKTTAEMYLELTDDELETEFRTWENAKNKKNGTPSPTESEE